MAGYRSRSRSYSPSRRRYSRSPPRYQRYDDPRDRYRGGGGGGGGGPRRGYGRPPAPTGLLVRNISLTARPEEIRIPFEQFGPVKDVYLPRNFHTRDRGHRDESPGDSDSPRAQDKRHCRLNGRSASPPDGHDRPVQQVRLGRISDGTMAPKRQLSHNPIDKL
ncbi:hypothetical protein ABZP36_019894 [Zizania latifolia]